MVLAFLGIIKTETELNDEDIIYHDPDVQEGELMHCNIEKFCIAWNATRCWMIKKVCGTLKSLQKFHTEKAKILIIGEAVHDTGYRVFLLNNCGSHSLVGHSCWMHLF